MASTQADLSGRIEAALSGAVGQVVQVTALAPLAGGACQENFRVELALPGGPRTMVLRADAPSSLPDSISRAQEFPVIGAAVASGVPTPAARWLTRGLTRPGAGAYFLDWADGVAIGAKVVRDPRLAGARALLPGQLAEALAGIHRVTPDTHPAILPDPPEDPAIQRLALLRDMLDRLPTPRPACELALRWLAGHLPRSREVTLVHGDFRVGNFLVLPRGLSAVLDWEFTHWGSPLEDIAWLCVRDWRFGSVTLPAGGLCDRGTFYRAYAAASGRSVDPAEVHFWEVLGNLKWAVGAVCQGERYLGGAARDLELLAIPRRAGEMEYEALRLIEVGPPDPEG